MEIVPILRQQEILILLLADMRNRKLILGLEQAGLEVQDFYTDLSTLIITKMGFESSSDAVNEWYEQTIEGIIDMDTPYFLTKQRDLALKMYDELVIKRSIANSKES